MVASGVPIRNEDQVKIKFIEIFHEWFLPRPGSFRKTHKQPEQPFQGHMPESFLSILGEFHIQSLRILVHFH